MLVHCPVGGGRVARKTSNPRGGARPLYRGGVRGASPGHEQRSHLGLDRYFPPGTFDVVRQTTLYRLLITTALTLLAAVAPGAPVPKAAGKPPLYLPTKVGAKWVYRDVDEEHAYCVTAVEETDGAKVVSVGEVLEDGRTAPVEMVAVSERGLFRVANYWGPVAPPECLLRLPTRPGNKWVLTSVTPTTPGRRELPTTCTAGTVARVVVLAGTFDARRIESECVVDRRVFRGTFWYTPGVGLVKAEVGSEVRVLNSYSPGMD
jgi:hypothetical protein